MFRQASQFALRRAQLNSPLQHRFPQMQSQQHQLFTQQQRLYFQPTERRTWVQKYDQEVVDKYPRVLEVIKGTLSKAALNTTERSALYVATFNSGVSGSRRIRKRERQTNFLIKVDALVTAWKDIEHQQKKINQRSTILKHAKANKLSTWKDRINGPFHQMDFTVTKQ